MFWYRRVVAHDSINIIYHVMVLIGRLNPNREGVK